MNPPFVLRLLLLLVIAGALSWNDYRRRGAKAASAREYGFVFLTGALGAAVGGLNDAITSRISPDYFILGKGLAEGDGLRGRAILYGLQAGCSGGIVAGAILVYLARRKSVTPAVSFRWLLRRLWIPIAGAVLGGLTLPRLAIAFDPFHLRAQLDSLLASPQVRQFLFVWWVHTGLYAGLVAGLAALLWRVGQERRRSVVR